MGTLRGELKEVSREIGVWDTLLCPLLLWPGLVALFPIHVLAWLDSWIQPSVAGISISITTGAWRCVFQWCGTFVEWMTFKRSNLFNSVYYCTVHRLFLRLCLVSKAQYRPKIRNNKTSVWPDPISARLKVSDCIGCNSPCWVTVGWF